MTSLVTFAGRTSNVSARCSTGLQHARCGLITRVWAGTRKRGECSGRCVKRRGKRWRAADWTDFMSVPLCVEAPTDSSERTLRRVANQGVAFKQKSDAQSGDVGLLRTDRERRYSRPPRLWISGFRGRAKEPQQQDLQTWCKHHAATPNDLRQTPELVPAGTSYPPGGCAGSGPELGAGPAPGFGNRCVPQPGCLFRGECPIERAEPE
ncbi:MAG: hypothetical protein QOG53_955 [Frankiales bacterium]|nr:hypothetical protein [Frankiales bacterium]